MNPPTEIPLILGGHSFISQLGSDPPHTLGRRAEASILAWNFFTDFAPGDPVGQASYYRPEHIDIILEQLRTSYVGLLGCGAFD